MYAEFKIKVYDDTMKTISIHYLDTTDMLNSITLLSSNDSLFIITFYFIITKLKLNLLSDTYMRSFLTLVTFSSYKYCINILWDYSFPLYLH